jgi:hypothetical protein
VDSGVAILGDWEEELLVPLRADRVLANLAVLSVFNSLYFIGYGSVSSVIFWASRIRILPSTSKKLRKTLISTYFDFLLTCYL